jgi:hypothetical protein
MISSVEERRGIKGGEITQFSFDTSKGPSLRSLPSQYGRFYTCQRTLTQEPENDSSARSPHLRPPPLWTDSEESTRNGTSDSKPTRTKGVRLSGRGRLSRVSAKVWISLPSMFCCILEKGFLLFISLMHDEVPCFMPVSSPRPRVKCSGANLGCTFNPGILISKLHCSIWSEYMS